MNPETNWFINQLEDSDHLISMVQHGAGRRLTAFWLYCRSEWKNQSEVVDYQGNMDDWLIIEKIGDVLVGTSIPYDYEKSRF